MIRTGTPEFFMQESTPDSLTEKIPTFQKLRTMKQLFFHLVPVLAFGLVLAACDNDSDEWTQPYEFAWSYGAESQFSVGKPATFTDLSLGVETREWSFEDATPATSTDPEPSVVFNSKGIKTVTLTIHFLNVRCSPNRSTLRYFTRFRLGSKPWNLHRKAVFGSIPPSRSALPKSRVIRHPTNGHSKAVRLPRRLIPPQWSPGLRPTKTEPESPADSLGPTTE